MDADRYDQFQLCTVKKQPHCKRLQKSALLNFGDDSALQLWRASQLHAHAYTHTCSAWQKPWSNLWRYVHILCRCRILFLAVPKGVDLVLWSRRNQNRTSDNELSQDVQLAFWILNSITHRTWVPSHSITCLKIGCGWLGHGTSTVFGCLGSNSLVMSDMKAVHLPSPSSFLILKKAREAVWGQAAQWQACEVDQFRPKKLGNDPLTWVTLFPS